MSTLSAGPDYFHLLNQPRQPWLDPEDVQRSFLSLSESVHPDRVHGGSPEVRARAHDAFAALNSACQVLRDPKARLAHLLELERGTKTIQLERVASDAADLYFQAGQACQEADRFLREKESVTSPLRKAQLFSRGMELHERLERVQTALNLKRVGLEAVAGELNRAWEAAPGVDSADRVAVLPLGRLEQLSRDYAYVSRWLGQLQERMVRLTF